MFCNVVKFRKAIYKTPTSVFNYFAHSSVIIFSPKRSWLAVTKVDSDNVLQKANNYCMNMLRAPNDNWMNVEWFLYNIIWNLVVC